MQIFPLHTVVYMYVHCVCIKKENPSCPGEMKIKVAPEFNYYYYNDNYSTAGSEKRPSIKLKARNRKGRRKITIITMKATR